MKPSNMRTMVSWQTMARTAVLGQGTFVQEGIYDEFVAKAAARANKRKIGNPWEEGVEHGPQVRTGFFAKMTRHFLVF